MTACGKRDKIWKPIQSWMAWRGYSHCSEILRLIVAIFKDGEIFILCRHSNCNINITIAPIFIEFLSQRTARPWGTPPGVLPYCYFLSVSLDFSQAHTDDETTTLWPGQSPFLALSFRAHMWPPFPRVIATTLTESSCQLGFSIDQLP